MTYRVYMRQWSGSSLVQALSPLRHQASTSTNISVLSSGHLLEIHTLLHTLFPGKLFENIFCTISAILPRPKCVKRAGAHIMIWYYHDHVAPPYVRENIKKGKRFLLFLIVKFDYIYTLTRLRTWLTKATVFFFGVMIWWNDVLHIASLRKQSTHDDVIKWIHFPLYWPFVWGIHLSSVNSPHKAHLREALMFSLICFWTNDWVNNQDAVVASVSHNVHGQTACRGPVLPWVCKSTLRVLRLKYRGRIWSTQLLIIVPS